MVNKYEKFGSRNFSVTGIGTTNGEGEGDIIYFGETNVAEGRIYALQSGAEGDPEWVSADADDATSGNLLAIAMATGSSGEVGMFLRGMIYLTGGTGLSAENAGKPIYLSTGAGLMTNVIPSASNDYVRIVGFFMSDNVIWFNPDNTLIKLA